MTIANSKPVVRLVDGGPQLGPLVVEIRDQVLTLRKHGQLGAVALNWSIIYPAAWQAGAKARRDKVRRRKLAVASTKESGACMRRELEAMDNEFHAWEKVCACVQELSLNTDSTRALLTVVHRWGEALGALRQAQSQDNTKYWRALASRQGTRCY